MAFCRNCGHEISESARFCDSCGASLGGEKTAYIPANADDLGKELYRAGPSDKTLRFMKRQLLGEFLVLLLVVILVFALPDKALPIIAMIAVILSLVYALTAIIYFKENRISVCENGVYGKMAAGLFMKSFALRYSEIVSVKYVHKNTFAVVEQVLIQTKTETYTCSINQGQEVTNAIWDNMRKISDDRI